MGAAEVRVRFSTPAEPPLTTCRFLGMGDEGKKEIV